MKVGRIKLKEYRGIELTHPEMRFLVGGSTGSGSKCKKAGNSKYYCECIDSVGAWSGCYPSLEDAIESGKKWCLYEEAECN